MSILVGSDKVVPRANPQVLQRNGQDRQYGQQLDGYQQKHVSWKQQQIDNQSQCYQQMQFYQQRLRDQGMQQQLGYQESQDNQQCQGYLHHSSVQQQHEQRPPSSRDHRINMKVLNLPMKVYSKICLKTQHQAWYIFWWFSDVGRRAWYGQRYNRVLWSADKSNWFYFLAI